MNIFTNKNICIALTFLAFLAYPDAASASEIIFSHTDPYSPEVLVGNSRTETIDVAMLVNAGDLPGGSISGLRIPVNPEAGISTLSVWLSKSLNLEDKNNAPDIMSAPAKIENGYIIGRFDNPYQLEEGEIYVGYSFTVDQLDDATKTPIVCHEGTTSGGLFMHSSKSVLKWKDISEMKDATSAMQLIINGDLPDCDISITIPDDMVFSHYEESFSFPITLTSKGASGLDNLKISYRFSENQTYKNTSITYPLEQPIYGWPQKAELTIPSYAGEGENILEVKVDEADGMPNTAAAPSASAYLFTAYEFPERKVLMEEFTGLWCGFCTRGLAAMDYVKTHYPDAVVPVSFHNRDDMEITAEYPLGIATFPNTCFDRMTVGDPYFDANYEYFALPESIDRQLGTISRANLDIKASRDDEKNSVAVTSDIKFTAPTSHQCAMIYILVADGLSDPQWIQSNKYHGTDPSTMIPEMERFCNGAKEIRGLVFDDVAIMTSETETTLPVNEERIAPDTEITHQYTFNFDKAISTSGYRLAEGASSLRVAAALIDTADGSVINAASCLVGSMPGGINSTEGEVSPVVSTSFYGIG